jgi:hypothetical protein
MIFNGKKIAKALYNGHEVFKGYHNGVSVFDNNIVMQYLPEDIQITRASQEPSPLELYNPTSLTSFPANTKIMHGDNVYVGGDTQTVTYDFGTKVANSVVECPMKVSYRGFTSIINPDGTWYEITTQSDLDKLKAQDSNAWNFISSTSSNIAQTMIEVDLTPLCNAMYGGSNAALKAALKGISVNAWAMGSGANAGATAYGADLKVWNATSGSYTLWASNTNNAIGKLSYNSAVNAYISSANKLYILIASQYASDGTITSSVSLDFIQVRVDLSRTPDVVSPIPVNLPKHWAMLVQGFSPSWAYDTTGSNYKRVFKFHKDASNGLQVSYDTSMDKFYVSKTVDGAGMSALWSGIQNFAKHNVINMLLQQTTSGVVFSILNNNGAVVTVSNTNVALLSGALSLYFGQNETNTNQMEALTAKYINYDLDKMCKAGGFTDGEADALLRGIPFQYNNLIANGDFSNGVTGWTGNKGTLSVSNNTASLVSNGTSVIPYIQQSLPALVGLNKTLYIMGKFRVTNPDCSSLRLNVYTGSESVVASSVTNPVQNTWYTASGIVNKAFTTGCNVTASNTYTDTTTSNGKVMEVQQMMVVDLTNLFGAGKEPTKEWCDANLPFIASAGNMPVAFPRSHVLPVKTGTVAILPSNKYHIEGTAVLSYNGVNPRTVTTGDVVTKAWETKAVLTAGSTIQLKM